MRNALLLCLLAGSTVAVVPSAHAAAGRRGLDRVVAIVNDDVILLSELENLTARHPLLQEALSSLPRSATQQMVDQKTREAKVKVLDELIDLALLRAEASKFDIEATDEEIDNAVADIARQYELSVDELRKQVIASPEYGNWADYRSEVRDQILQYKVPHYLATWSVSEAQVREHYRKLTKDESAKVKVRQFAFNPPSQKSGDRDRVFAAAQAVARQLREGKTPDEVAKTTDKDAPERTVGRGDVAPALEDALFDAKDGQVVGPLASGQGYVVFKVVEHVESAALEYEQAKARIRQQLEAEAFLKAQSELREQMRDKAHIDIRL